MRKFWLALAAVATIAACSGDGNGNGNGNNNNNVDDDGYTTDDNPNADEIPDGAELTDSWDGDLSDGSVPDDLDFLESAFCVPGTEFVNMDGAHVFYDYDQPAGKQVYVRVRPEGDVDVSLYVSQLPGGSSGSGPGDVADPCEASLDQANDNNPGEAESVKLTSIELPYFLLIGVAGANGTTTGGFRVEVYEE